MIITATKRGVTVQFKKRSYFWKKKNTLSNINLLSFLCVLKAFFGRTERVENLIIKSLRNQFKEKK